MALSPGGDLPAHKTDQPVQIHVTDGDIVFHAAGDDYKLAKGDTLVFAAGVEHSAESADGCVFLLTVVRSDAGTGSHDAHIT